MDDRVDRTLADWHRERPDLDMSHVGLTLRILLIGKYIERHAARSLAELDLQPWEFDVLGALRRQGEPCELSASELARKVVLTCSAMTHRISRLEERGLVARRRRPSDRRSVGVQLTSAGRQLVDRAVECRVAELSRLMDVVDGEDRDRVVGSLRTLLLRLEAEEE
jgi:DNA-binding MarR family transcriptional regulator